MNLPYDENEEIEELRELEEKKERERRLREAKREARRAEKASGAKAGSLDHTAVMKVFLCLIVILTLLVALMYGGLLLREQFTEAGGGTAEQAAPVISNAVVYSQEEVDAMIAAAVSEAKSNGSAEVLDAVKNSFVQGMTTTDMLRALYPDDIVVASGGRYHFVPVDRSLRLNQLVPENINVLDSGEFQYLQNGQVVSHKGIDVSSHQGNIDWQKVAADGVEFAFVRAIFRGYGSGKLVEDEQFDNNMTGAIGAGVKVGVYVFSQAITEEEVREEAALVLSKVAPYRLDCPIVFDVEMISGDGRMNALSVEERTGLTLLFCQLIEEAGYPVMITHNTEMAAVRIDFAALEKYDKWDASYSRKMFFPYEYKVWQYSDKGKVQGISGNVDMNLCIDPVWE